MTQTSHTNGFIRIIIVIILAVAIYAAVKTDIYQQTSLRNVLERLQKIQLAMQSVYFQYADNSFVQTTIRIGTDIFYVISDYMIEPNRAFLQDIPDSEISDKIQELIKKY